ncbi:hypothetical protein HDU87_002146 [Geranomyces variabilis]|uniref:Fibronectin type-III domain-containing protein n=1 Tax=Geranomyces variabilis TaxID=109894 RepID=A0AAD5TNW7_9FUNG|nr:hypothetical protein HDU87_002146 [Geranomyces variabilis]
MSTFALRAPQHPVASDTPPRRPDDKFKRRKKHQQTPHTATMLLPLSKGPDGPFLNLVAPPKDLISPLLGRMSPESLRATFDTEIVGCIKRMRMFAAHHSPEERDTKSPSKYKASRPRKLDPATVPLHVSPNTRRRLLSTQLTKCWDMFGPHVEQEYLYERMIEAGEQILTIDGFADAANATCFERFLESAPSSKSFQGPCKAMKKTLFPSTAQATPGFALPARATSAPQTLHPRAQYGNLVCKFYSVHSVDPLLKSPGMVASVVDVLQEMLNVVASSYELADRDQIAFLVWQGTRSVRAICETLGAASWWAQIPEIALRALKLIEACPTLRKLSFIGWRLDLYVTLHQANMHHDVHEHAADLINDAMTKVEEAGRDAVNAIVRSSSTAAADIVLNQEIVATAIFRLNVLMFGCEVRGIADGKQIANGEALTESPGGSSNVTTNAIAGRGGRRSVSSGAPGGPRASISIANSEILDEHRSTVLTQTPLRKLVNACPIRGGTFWPSDETKRDSATASVMNLNQSRQNLAGTYTSALASLISLQTDATGDLVWKPKAGGRTLVRNLSIRAISQLKSAGKQRKPFVQHQKQLPGRQISTNTATDAESTIAYGIPDNPPDDEDTVPEMPYKDLSQIQQTQREIRQSTVKSGRKMRNTLPRVDESEEGKARRQILFDVLYMLASFHGDRDRFHAIVEGLYTLSSPVVRLTFIEKLSDGFNRKEQLFMRMLDAGFDMIMSEPEEFLTPHKVMAAYTTDLQLGRAPHPADVTRLIMHQRLALLHLEDLMGFSRKLFEYHQWERFSVLARVMDGMFDTDAFSATTSKANQEAARRELVLRLAAVNFQNVLQTERKLRFDPQEVSSSMDDLQDRFAVSNHLHAAAIALLDALADCIETDSLVSRHPRLFEDTARLLWGFLEPLLRPVTSTSDASQCGTLTMDSLLVILLRSLHAVLAELPSEDSLLLVDVGGKLSLILECMGSLKEAIEVLEDIEAVILIARCRFGEPADGITSATFNVNFQKGERRTMDCAGTAPLVVEPKRNQDGVISTDQLVLARRNLACAGVSVYRRLFRCEMKLALKSSEQAQKKKAADHYRLTNKHLHFNPVLTNVDEQRVEAYCGENLVLRALVLVAHASEGSNLDKASRNKLLTQAAELLRCAFRDENRLVDQIFGEHAVKPRQPFVCPPPLFVRRSPTSITVRPVHMVDNENQPVIPHSYRLYARKVTKDSVPLVTVSDVAYPGSGYQVRVPPSGDGSTELTVTGLKPNHRYVLAVCAFDAADKPIGQGIGETSRPILACLPLPLLLCWGHVANVAHEAQCGDIADVSYKVLREQYVSWLAPDARLRRTVFEKRVSGDPYAEEVFRLNDLDLSTTAPSIIRTFVEAIYASIDREFSRTHAIVHSDVEGISDVLTAQILRLKCCRELLIALELAKRIEDQRLMLLSSFKCYELLVPLLQNDDVADPAMLQLGSQPPTPLPYVVQVLMLCHTTFIKCSAVLGNDRVNGVMDHYAYIAFHLVRRLTARRVPADLARAVQVAEEALSIIRSIAGEASSDIKIPSSTTLEAEWLGPEHRAAKRRISKKKGKGRAIVTECAYHALLASTAEHAKGFENHGSRRLEAMCEYFDVEIGRATLIIPPPGQPALRKGLDSASTSTRDIYAVLALSGPDIAIENITRFRKNPRYIEIMALAAGWCLAAGHFIDTAIRICLDAEDWTEKRNYCLLNFDEVAGDHNEAQAAEGKKEGWWNKKKKKGMFADKTAGLTAAGKGADKKRGRKSKRSGSPTRAATSAAAPSRVPSGGPKDASPGPASSTSRSRPSTGANQHPKSADSDHSPHPKAAASRPGSPSKLAPGRAASRPGSPERSHTRANSATSGATEDIGARTQQRVSSRQNYLATLSSSEREKIERAARILDSSLAGLWHRRRYCRRLRLVIEFEASARARLSLVHGLASFAHLERDAVGRDFGANEAVRRGEFEAFELRNCGRILLEDLGIPHQGDAVGVVQAEQPSNEAFRFVTDSFQAIVQSVVIASRVADWLQVMDSIKHLWRLQQRLLRRGMLVGLDFRRNNLWRAWWIVGLCIIDFLQSVSVRPAETDSAEPLAQHMPSSRPSTGQAFAYPSRPVTATFCRSRDRGRNVLPFRTLSEMNASQYVATWADRHGELQTTFLELHFLSHCGLFAIETLAVAKKHHRLMEFSLKFDQVFRGIYAPILQPILADAYQGLQRKIGEDSLGPVLDQVELWLDSREFGDSLSQQLLYARGLAAEHKLGTVACRPNSASTEFSELYTDAAEAYDDAIATAAAEGNHTMTAVASAEYAELLFTSGDRDGACLFWSRAIDAVFVRSRVVTDWRSLFGDGEDWTAATSKMHRQLVERAGGIRNLVLAGTAATRMAQARYGQINLDKKHSLTSLAAKTFTILLRATLPHPANPAELAQYVPPYVLPELHLFSDQNRCNPWNLFDVLLFLTNELLATQRPAEALPLASLMEYLAVNACFCTSLLCTARMLKAETLVSLGFIADGLEALLTVSSGAVLLPEERMFYAVPSSGAGAPLPPDVRYQDQMHLLDSITNLRVLRFVADHVLPDRLVWFIGQASARDFDLCRSRIVLNVMEMAGLGDPGITQTKLSMFFYQEDPNAEDEVSISDIPLRGNNRTSIDSLGTASLSRASSHASIGAPGGPLNKGRMTSTASLGAANLATTRTPRRDVSSVINSILPRLEAIVAKIVSDLQMDADGLQRRTKSQALLRCFEVSAGVNVLRLNFGAVIRCLSSISHTIHELEKHAHSLDATLDPHIDLALGVDPALKLYCLERLITGQTAHGSFRAASTEARRASTLAQKLSSSRFTLIFELQALTAEWHAELCNTVAVPSPRQATPLKDDTTWKKALKSFEDLLHASGAKPGAGNQRERARAWEFLGDATASLQLADSTKVLGMYGKAILCWKKVVTLTSSRPTGYNETVKALAGVQLKRELLEWRINPQKTADVFEALEVIAGSIKTLVCLSPSFTVPIALAHASAHAASRMLHSRGEVAYESAWTAASIAFSDLLAGLVGEGGFDVMSISAVLSGLAALRMDKSAESGEELMIAALGYQSGRCACLRRSQLDGTAVMENVKVKMQDINVHLAQEFAAWMAGSAHNAGSEAPVLLTTPAAHDLLIVPPQASAIAATTVKGQDLYRYLCHLVRIAHPMTGPPTDVFELATLTRIRRVHACLAEHVGAPYLHEHCMPDSVIPKADSVIPLVPGSQILPDEVTALCWSGLQSTSNAITTRDATASTSVIVISTSKRKDGPRSAKRQKTPPAPATAQRLSVTSLRSSTSATPPQTTTVTTPPTAPPPPPVPASPVVAQVAFPTAQLVAIQEILKKVNMVLDLADEDEEFGEEVHDIWESVMNNIRTGFGCSDDEIPAPHFSEKALSIIVELFDVPAPPPPNASKSFAFRATGSKKEAEISAVYSWLGRLAASLQSHSHNDQAGDPDESNSPRPTSKSVPSTPQTPQTARLWDQERPDSQDSSASRAP